MIDARQAKNMFEAGPAIAIIIISDLGFLRFCIRTGTGYAHPNPKKYNAKVPKGSK